MTAMLRDCRERDEPLAGLSASEGGIYGRYGYLDLLSVFDCARCSRARLLADASNKRRRLSSRSQARRAEGHGVAPAEVERETARRDRRERQRRPVCESGSAPCCPRG